MKLLKETPGVRYELFDLSARDEMALLVSEAFIRYEPMAVAQNFSQKEFIEFINLLAPKAEKKKLTITAKDKATEKIIGTLIAEDFVSPLPSGMEKLSEKFGPIFALLDELDGRYKQKRDIKLGDCLHVYIVAIDQLRHGERSAQTLIGVCLENAIRQGYKVAVTEATGLISQHVFRKLGFVDRHEILYKTFAYEGRQVFESIAGHTGTILMDKVLT